MVGVWLLVVAGSLAGHAHAQLGEGAGGHHTTTTDTTTTTTQTTTTRTSKTMDNPSQYDFHAETEGVKKAEEPSGGAEEPSGGAEELSGGAVMRAPHRWIFVKDTYMGCLHEQTNFNDTLVFLNLQEFQWQVELKDPLTSLEAACYQMCLVEKPFTEYITVAEAVNGSADACGCHYEVDLDLENTVDDASCAGGMLEYYGVYCGPGNEKCFNGAPGVGRPALALVMILLPLLLTS